ncbi:hypothetical protein LCGC14_0986410 [marine sediment metagenome]|uniref:Uncharacterized protein n=1 Tax=marine sediment metagenome TaxID=412755 RepID=A0A0F9NBN9_9ZZZZ
MKKPAKLVMVDGSPYNAMMQLGDTVYKAKSHKGVQIVFEAIDLEKYDKRVNDLADALSKMPGVDLRSLLTDALFDLPLDYLKTVETKIYAEMKKPEPKIVTKVDPTYRGSCVNLNVGGKNLVELRH